MPMNKSKNVEFKNNDKNRAREEHQEMFKRRGERASDEEMDSNNDSDPEIVASKPVSKRLKKTPPPPPESQEPEEAYETDEEELNLPAEKKLKVKVKTKSKEHQRDHEEEDDEEEDEDEARWERLRKERAKEQYMALIKKEIVPSPRGRYFLVDIDPKGRKNYQMCLSHIATSPQDNIGFQLGEERPIYCIFQQKRPHAFLPHLAILDTGELRADALRKFGYIEDLFQANKARSPKPIFPYVGQSKACLSLGDLENLRREGPSLVQRGKELTQMGVAKPRFITLGSEGKEDADDEETASTNSAAGAAAAANSDLPPSRILMHLDDRGEIVYQFYRISSSPSGASIDSGNTRFTLRIAEMVNLLSWIPAIYEETFRLASSRVATNSPMTKELKDCFKHSLLVYLVERVHGEGYDLRETDPEVVYDFLADIVRSTSSGQLKKEINCARGSKENFQAFHLEVCCDGALKTLVKSVRSTILNSSNKASL